MIRKKENLFKIISLRTEWENLVQNFAGVSNEGTMTNVREFLKRPVTHHRFNSPRYQKALALAREMVALCKN